MLKRIRRPVMPPSVMFIVEFFINEIVIKYKYEDYNEFPLVIKNPKTTSAWENLKRHTGHVSVIASILYFPSPKYAERTVL